MRSFIWQSKPWQAFMNFAIIFSFIVNIVLVIVLLLIAPIVLPIVGQIVNPLVGGLTESFVEMGEASIQQTIIVDDEIPIQFILPLNARTDVVLAEAVPLQVQAQFVLPNGGGTINGIVNLQLPNNLVLPVNLSLDVPVSQTVPVLLKVPVNIPLAETELGTPFSRLQSLFVPLNGLLSGLPASNEELAERFAAGE
jgi:hypothetical protein